MHRYYLDQSTTVMYVDHNATPAYERAYTELVQTTLIALSNVESKESAQKFISDTIANIRQQEQAVSEFYKEEFIQLLKDAAWEQRQADVLGQELIVEEAKEEGKAAGAELTVRLAAARASGDRQAQHAVWREQKVRLA